jgi:hypothetical protein
VSSPCQSQQRTSDWIREDQSTRYGNHGHQIESEGVVTHPQSQTRTEKAAWLTVQLRGQHTTDQGIPAIPTAKVMGVVYVFQHIPHYACLAVKLISTVMIHSH